MVDSFSSSELSHLNEKWQLRLLRNMGLFVLTGPKSKVMLITVGFKHQDMTKGVGKTEICVWVISKYSVSNFDLKEPVSIRALCVVLCGDMHCFYKILHFVGRASCNDSW